MVVIDATVLMSGGLDSTVCAHFLKAHGHRVKGLFVDFGQRAALQERRALDAISKILSIPIEAIRLDAARDYASGEIVGRNAFLVFTALLLRRQEPGIVCLGIHSGSPYYDCSARFVGNLGKLVVEHTNGRVSLLTPLLDWSKQEIFTYAKEHEIPISTAYSCEAGAAEPCGICASCRDRRALGC